MRNVRVSLLPNGLRVVSDPMDGIESVSVGVWIDVGTRSEPESAQGVAHLLEHMLFKGTERRSAQAIAEEIEAVGGHLNAYTGREQTAYYGKVLKGDLALAIDLLADILQNSVFDEEELKRERAVVLQEIGQAEDTPDDIVFDHIQAVAYAGQPLGRPVLGDAKIVAKMPRAQIASYKQEHYLAGDMVLVAAGAVAHEQLVALANTYFSGMAPGRNQHHNGAAYCSGDKREERDLEQVHMILGLPGVAYEDPEYFAHAVLSNLLGGGMSSRLFQEVRERRGLAYSIHSFAASFRDNGLFGVYAGTGEKEAEQVIELICGELKRVEATLTEEEVARSRAQIKAGMLMGLESTSARCEQLAQHLLVFGRVLPLAELIADVEAADLTRVRAAVGRLLALKPCFAAVGPLSRVARYDSIGGMLA
ncbi:MAG: insulinase family protein [Alphaproteobacteria bacterium]|nr:insulinase family protein [Alphaproteobacteria bacterium]